MPYIHLRIDDDIKRQSRDVLESLGLDLSTAVTLFLKQVVIRKGIPFSIADAENLTPEQLRMLLQTMVTARPGADASARRLRRKIHRAIGG